jgi:hypothetical protein
MQVPSGQKGSGKIGVSEHADSAEARVDRIILFVNRTWAWRSNISSDMKSDMSSAQLAGFIAA